MNTLLRSQLRASVEQARLADDHLDRAVIFLTHAVVYLDEACKLDPVLCKRVEAIPHQDELECIRNKLRSLALDAATEA